jgi:hypothetical protein
MKPLIERFLELRVEAENEGLNGASVLWPRRAAEPYHVQVLLGKLYGTTPPSVTPASSIIPTKSERNKEIFRRYQAGESPSLLAREYGISEQRFYVILRKQR